MASQRRIYLALKGYLEDARIFDLTGERIFESNEAIETGKDEMYVVIEAYPLAVAENRTERLAVMPYCVNIVLCTPLRLGNAYASSVANRITSRFSEQSPDKCAFNMPGGKFYVTAVQQASGYVENSMYRNVVQVLIDVYEVR